MRTRHAAIHNAMPKLETVSAKGGGMASQVSESVILLFVAPPFDWLEGFEL
jgi:hypothetical protein